MIFPVRRVHEWWLRASLGERGVAAAMLLFAASAAIVGPILTADTTSYLAHTNVRPPAYPLFLDAVRLVFRGHALRAAVFAQLLFSGISCVRFGRRLGSFIGAGGWLVAIVQAVLFSVMLKFGRTISTEALSYGAFLVFLDKSVDCFQSRSIRNLLVGAAFLALLIFLRGQFLFILPVVLCSLLMTAMVEPREAWRLLLVAMALLVVLAAVPRIYGLACSGSPRSTSATGVQLLTVVLYVAVPADGEALADRDERRYFDALIARASAGSMLSVQRKAGMPVIHHFSQYYNDLCFGLIVPEYAKEFLGLSLAPTVAATTGRMSSDAWANMDAFQLKMAVHLLRRAARRYAVHVVGTILELYKTYVIVVLGMMLAGLLDRARPIGKLMVGIGLLWIANVVLVTMVEIPMGRYTFYVDTVIGATVLMLLCAGVSGTGNGALRAGAVVPAP